MKKNCPNKSCPHHNNNLSIIKVGRYFRKADSKHIQRFKCTLCGKNFSAATETLEYRHRKRRQTPMILKLLASNVSMRRVALILNLHRTTVKRKMLYLSILAKRQHLKFLKELEKTPIMHMQFDDLVTIEHTKLKPLSVSIAIDAKSRRFLDIQVSRIPAFGHLAQKSVKKYGKRRSEHKKGLRRLFTNLEKIIDPEALIQSDEHKFYPEFVTKHFPRATYERFRGGKGCIAGQGELKKLHFDPLFTLNHNFAMLRANINRLIRRTWCTTKDPQMLLKHLLIYINYHNQNLIVKK